MYSKTSLCVITLLLCAASCCYAADPNCDPCNLPQYIRVILTGVIPVNANCGDCKITSEDINGSYILNYIEPDSDYPWHRWCYNIFSLDIITTTRIPGFSGPYDRANGLRVCVTKDRYSSNTLWVEAVPTCVSQYGYAVYFSARKAPIDSGCVANNSGIVNEQNRCYCAVWYYIAPWSAGLGGTAVIEELPANFLVYNEFANEWLTTGHSIYDFDGDDDVDFDDLAIFADMWLMF